MIAKALPLLLTKRQFYVTRPLFLPDNYAPPIAGQCYEIDMKSSSAIPDSGHFLRKDSGDFKLDVPRSNLRLQNHQVQLDLQFSMGADQRSSLVGAGRQREEGAGRKEKVPVDCHLATLTVSLPLTRYQTRVQMPQVPDHRMRDSVIHHGLHLRGKGSFGRVSVLDLQRGNKMTLKAIDPGPKKKGNKEHLKKGVELPARLSRVSFTHSIKSGLPLTTQRSHVSLSTSTHKVVSWEG